MVELRWAGPDEVSAVDGAAAAFDDTWRTVVPDDPPFPASELAAELRHPGGSREKRLLVAIDGGDVAGAAVLELDRSGNNANLAVADDLCVRRHARRRGVGRALLEALRQAAKEDGRRSLVAYSPPGGAAPGFAAAVGARPGLLERHSRAATAELDRHLLRGWVDRAAERAADYELVAFDGPCPDDLLEHYAAVRNVMNTMPRSEVWEDFHVDAAQARSWLADAVARGRTPWTVMAVHRPTGTPAGYTTLLLNEHRPWLAEQDDTGVDPAHRHRGIGRWLKAANALRLLDEAPEVRVIETWNAEVNEAMLTINVAMGFRQVSLWQEWELDA